ncbi:hypothetical protein PGT21_011391 [Puccinia graminis f. sp. tritici]|nr:hypothetical protein PGT21_011391 [Puccinia graminis f. sp. tritici]
MLNLKSSAVSYWKPQYRGNRSDLIGDSVRSCSGRFGRLTVVRLRLLWGYIEQVHRDVAS